MVGGIRGGRGNRAVEESKVEELKVDTTYHLRVGGEKPPHIPPTTYRIPHTSRSPHMTPTTYRMWRPTPMALRMLDSTTSSPNLEEIIRSYR